MVDVANALFTNILTQMGSNVYLTKINAWKMKSLTPWEDVKNVKNTPILIR